MALHKPMDVIFGKSQNDVDAERAEAVSELESAIEQIADMAMKLSAIYSSIKWRPFPLFFCGSNGNKNELDDIEFNLGYVFFAKNLETPVITKFIIMMSYMEKYLYDKMLLNNEEHKAAGGQNNIGIDSLVDRINRSGARDDDRIRLVGLMLKTIHGKYSVAINVFKNDIKKHSDENYGLAYSEWREKSLPYALKVLECPSAYLANKEYKRVFIDAFKPKTTYRMSMSGDEKY